MQHLLAFLVNWDLVAVSIVVGAMVVLSFTVLWSNKKSATHLTFFGFVLSVSFWSILNYFSFQPFAVSYSFTILRFTILAVTFFTFFFLLFALSFPREKIGLSKISTRILGIWTLLISTIVLTPLVLKEVESLAPNGSISSVTNGPLMPLFGMTTVGYGLIGVIILILKTFRVERINRGNFIWVTGGVTAMFLSVMTSNFLLPVVFNNSTYLPFAALFVFPFIALTSYTILRHKLFNVRAMWVGVLVFLLAVTSFFEVIFAGELSLILYRGAIFLLILFFGILIIKGIIREAKQREEIQELASRLKNVNSILAHDIKNTLGKNRDIFVETLAGTFGEITDQGKSFFKRLNMDTGDLITSVMNILKSGDTMKPNPQPFDFKEAVLDAVASVKDKAEAEKIKIEIKIDEKEDYTVNADRSLIVPHVLKNLIENAVIYNVQNGSIWINLSKKDPKTILLMIKGTGWGMTEEDKNNLFKPGGHGPDSIKKNVHTSGFGLYIAKQTMDVHNGKVYGISEGRGKGSTFFVELPVDFTPAISEISKIP